MEGVAADMYRNMKRLWRRRGYKRLEVAGTGRRRNKAELGRVTDPSRRRRRFWRIRVGPRLRLISPKKFLIGLRGAYENFMLRLASSSAAAGGGGVGVGGGFGYLDYRVGGFGTRSRKKYDEKLIIEIYKSLVMSSQHQLVLRNQHQLVLRNELVPSQSGGNKLAGDIQGP